MKFQMKNKAITIIAAIAFLLHALVPFYASYQIPTENHAKQMSSLFGDKVMLCTAEGFKLVSWEDLLGGKEHPKPHKQYQCPLCYFAAHGQGIQPDNSNAFAATQSIKQHTLIFSLNDESLSRESLWRKLRMRSPPFSFAV